MIKANMHCLILAVGMEGEGETSLKAECTRWTWPSGRNSTHLIHPDSER